MRSPTPTGLVRQHPAEESNLVLQIRNLPCLLHTRRANRRQHPDLESNQDLDFRRVPCDPLHHRDVFKSRRLELHQHDSAYKADAFLGRATSASRGIRRELNPYLLLHRQVCLPRTPRTPCCSSGKGGSRTLKAVRLNRLPTGSRRRSGCPSVLFSSPTRTRTRNTSLEARDDVRFTIGLGTAAKRWSAEGMGFEPTSP